MSDIVRLHHEDWDFAKLFGDLKAQGIKSVKLQLPIEWENDDKLKTEKVTELLKVSEAAGVNIQELVPHNPKQRDSSPAVSKKQLGQNDGSSVKFGPERITGNGHLKFFIGLGVFLIILVVAGGIVLSQRAFREQRQTLQSPTAVIPVQTPRPEADQPLAEVLNRGDLTVRVLNGSGRRGAAGELAKFLEDLGYSVSITGNTNLQTGSKLRLKSGSEIYRDILTADLESKLEAASGSALPQADVAGAEVIIGQN